MASCVYCLNKTVLVSFQPVEQLKDTRNKHAKGKDESKPHGATIALEHVDELTIGHLGHEVEHDVCHRVVDPMEHNAGNDGMGAVIHPTKDESDQRGMYKLR